MLVVFLYVCVLKHIEINIRNILQALLSLDVEIITIRNILPAREVPAHPPLSWARAQVQVRGSFCFSLNNVFALNTSNDICVICLNICRSGAGAGAGLQGGEGEGPGGHSAGASPLPGAGGQATSATAPLGLAGWLDSSRHDLAM